MTVALPFGSWPSPITAESLVRGAVGISEVIPDGDDVWWAESRPTEGGRTAIMRWTSDIAVEVTPPDADVRTRVHEYGGGAWWVDKGVCYYVDFADQRLRRLEPGGKPLLLTPDPDVRAGLRYADGRVTPDGEWFVCVRESHHTDGREATNEVVAVATDGSMRVEVIASGADFYASPRVGPDGLTLVWIQWMHPDMPWDATELWWGELNIGGHCPNFKLAGNGDEALQQPEWAEGRLFVLSDRDEWWNLYAVDGVSGELTLVVGGPFEIATPHWVFGLSRYADGMHVAGTAAGDALVPAPDLPYTSIGSLRRSGDAVVFVAASFATEPEVVRLRGSTLEVIRSARDLGLDPGYLVAPEPITFPTTDGAEAHALYYPPASPDHVGTPGELPPLLVVIHGGPTSAARRQLNLGHRFWTSRGFAVVDVDYRGSTGYGRTYRKGLTDGWGIVDVDDAVAAACFLAARGDVDVDRLLIRGGSAGGFTTLAAMAFRDVFAAGASHYGVADLEALATDTHKFESRYLDQLIGPYPEARDVYVERSPISHTPGFSAPLIILQGDEDAVVPPSQAEMIVEALRDKGVPVAYLLFEGEQHGFRRAENIIRAIEAELDFYGKVLGFEPADDIEPVVVENL
ncbi:MAG: prolyl oligopeptidase family serine peptidase [Acidimicrobiia bacterium]|nr:prolyl oligopeptidase family serine peptidase [Acidimicrobiia bacterium]